MSINKKLNIGWKGETYSLLITMREVDEIENDFNLILFANQINQGDCRYSKLSWLVAKCLRFAGGDETQDSAWCEMFGKGNVSPADALEIGKSIVSACLPEIPEEAAAKKKSTRKKRKK